jgi:hypothetical protein
MTNYKSYERTAVVECIDNNNLVDAHVINYVEGKYLTVSLNTVRVNLQYNQKYKNYIGAMGGLEFQSTGPKALGYYR